jgi:hypothetical protein
MLDRLTELYMICDDFCKHYENWQKKCKQITDKNKPKTRCRKGLLTLSEIVCILVLYQSSNMKNFKSFYLTLGFEIKSAFPNLCSYQRFIALREKAIPVLILLHYAVLSSCDGISYVDSTTIKACHIKREKRHKTFKLWAKKSKGTMGWFYGFKLHIIVNSKGELLNAFFSAGNVDDRDGLREMCKNIFGDIVGDRGYIGKDLKTELSEKGMNLITRAKKNMKKQSLSLKEDALLKSRNIIETVIGKLKIECTIEHTRHRSLNGLMINILCALISYSLMSKKPKTEIKYAKNIDLNCLNLLLNAA